MSNNKTTALIIVNYRTPWHLNECIKSIFKHTDNFHIILVQNSTDKESINLGRKFKAKYPNQITVIENGKNLGFVGGVNKAYEKAMEFERACLVNSDIIVTENWLKELNIAMDSDKDVVQVSPDCSQFHEEAFIWRIVKWQILRRFPLIGSYIYKLQLRFNPPRAENKNDGFGAIGRFTDFPGGYCNIFKTEFFKDLGYFCDPNIVHGYWDDFDFSMYLRQFGKVGATMRSYVFHFENISFNKIPLQKKQLKNKLMLLNGLYVMDKWQKEIKAELSKLSEDDLISMNESYVMRMIYTYFGLVNADKRMADYIRSLPAKEIGEIFLK